MMLQAVNVRVYICFVAFLRNKGRGVGTLMKQSGEVLCTAPAQSSADHFKKKKKKWRKSCWRQWDLYRCMLFSPPLHTYNVRVRTPSAHGLIFTRPYSPLSTSCTYISSIHQTCRTSTPPPANTGTHKKKAELKSNKSPKTTLCFAFFFLSTAVIRPRRLLLITKNFPLSFPHFHALKPAQGSPELPFGCC